MNLLLRNYCQECGRRIPRVSRAFFGNKYVPVVCRACSDALSARVYGSVGAANAALFSAAAKEVREHGWPR